MDTSYFTNCKPIFCDFEVTDGTKNGEIFQIGAVVSTKHDGQFSRHILPHGPIHWYVSKKVTKVAIRCNTEQNRELYDLRSKLTLPSVTPKNGFQSFVDWLSEMKKVNEADHIVLVTFGNLELDRDCLYQNLKLNGMFEEFKTIVSDVYDCQKFVANMGFEGGLEKVYSKLFPGRPLFKHHDAFCDAMALFEILEELAKEKQMTIEELPIRIREIEREKEEEHVRMKMIGILASGPKSKEDFNKLAREEASEDIVRNVLENSTEIFSIQNDSIRLSEPDLVNYILNGLNNRCGDNVIAKGVVANCQETNMLKPIRNFTIEGKTASKNLYHFQINGLRGVVVSKSVDNQQTPKLAEENPVTESHTKSINDNPVTHLNNMTTRRNYPTPVYSFSKILGSSEFTCQLIVTAKNSEGVKCQTFSTQSNGPTKKEAKQASAKAMLELLCNKEENQDEDKQALTNLLIFSNIDGSPTLLNIPKKQLNCLMKQKDLYTRELLVGLTVTCSISVVFKNKRTTAKIVDLKEAPIEA